MPNYWHWKCLVLFGMIGDKIMECEDLQFQQQNTSSELGCGVPVLISAFGIHLVGVIETVNAHALSILVHQNLAEGSRVSIEYGAVTGEGEIVSCRPAGSHYRVYIAMAQKNNCDLRADERFPVTEEVRIRTAGWEYELDGLITDLSMRGIGLETPKALATGETVTVESASNVAFGIVRYCRQIPGALFHAGVEVFHVMPKEP